MDYVVGLRIFFGFIDRNSRIKVGLGASTIPGWDYDYSVRTKHRTAKLTPVIAIELSFDVPKITSHFNPRKD